MAWVREIQHVLHPVKKFHYSLRRMFRIFDSSHLQRNMCCTKSATDALMAKLC